MEEDSCGQLHSFLEKLIVPEYDYQGLPGDYSCTSTVLGISQTGSGRTKQLAKKTAARNLLAYFKTNVGDKKDVAREVLVATLCQNPTAVNRSVKGGGEGGDVNGSQSKCQCQPKGNDRTVLGNPDLSANKSASASRSVRCPVIEKDADVEDVTVTNLKLREVEIVRRDNNIIVQHLVGNGGQIPDPIQSFREAFAKHPHVIEAIRKVGFEKPSPVQMQALPITLEGQDLIGISPNGTGKTLAFLLPAFIHVESQPADHDNRGASVLVLTPTRDRVLHIENEIQGYKYRDIKYVCLSGRVNRMEQTDATSGVDIIVATPGLLLDLLNSQTVDVRSVTYLVLDDADRMMDLGLQPDIQKILLRIRPKHQTIITSACWSDGLRCLAANCMKNPVQVSVGSTDLMASAERRKKEGRRGRGFGRPGGNFQDDVGGFSDRRGGEKVFPFTTDNMQRACDSGR